MRNTLCLILLLCQAASARGTAQMTLDTGPVTDKRFVSVRNTDNQVDLAHLSTSYKTRSEWQARATELRQQVLGAAGLLPAIDKTPMNTRVFGKIECDGYTVEKVCFESLPGFYCTGNLYRPRPSTGSGRGPYPATLNPHGHWQEGRLVDSDNNSIPGRAINFAKQGYISFCYDMIGYNDSRQLGHDDSLADRRSRLWGLSLCGLQTLNSIRALDFVLSLPDVDKDYIACTGGSGGASQTFLLAAVDDRVKVTAPVNMISASMQGGCRCENMPNLRIDTNNIEIAAASAPRPMQMVAATGDWTKNCPTVEYPAIRSIYKLFDAEDRVACAQFDLGHNYNKTSRGPVYAWFGRWLPRKPLEGPITEQPFTVPPDSEMLVFPDGKLPGNGLDRDGIVKQWMRTSEDQLEANRPKDLASLDRFQKLYEPALRSALSIPRSVNCKATSLGTENVDGATITRLILRGDTRGIETPALLFDADGGGSGPSVLLVHEKGKRAFLNRQGTAPGALVSDLVKRGCRVLTIDTFGTGEHIAPEGTPVRDYDKDFFDTYNRTDTAERICDILLALSYLTTSAGHGERVDLVGCGKAGLWCLLAKPFSPNVDRLVMDAAGVDVSNDNALTSDLYIPCLRRAGDFRTAMALCAPSELFIHNTQGRFDTVWAESAYKAAKHTSALEVSPTRASDTDIAGWLVGQ